MISETAKIPTATVAPLDHSKSTNMNYETASDFKEDPFQNYRYEDPFLISDPFPEEEAAAPVVKVEGEKDLLSNFQILNFFSLKTETKFEQKEENLFRKFSFENAVDPFASGSFSTTSNGNNDGNNNYNIDPFGSPINGNKKDTSNGFGFEADFANFDAFDSTGGATKASYGSTKNGSFGAFDAWSPSMDKTNNNVGTGKLKKGKQPEVSKINKFSADYSDNFDKDLEQVLKRSVMDQ